MQDAQKATDSVTKAIEGSTKVTPIFKNRMSQLTAELENTNSKLELQKAKLEELKSEGAGLNESAITQMQKLERESANLDSQIRDLTSRIAELKEEQKGVGEFHAGMIGEEIRQYEDQLSSLIAKADETGFKMADLQDKMDLDTKRHQEKILNAEGTILRLQKSIDSTNTSIAKMQEQMHGTGNAIEETRKEMTKVSKSVNNMGKQFTQAFKRIAKQVLIFAVLYKAIRELQKFMSSSLKTNTELSASLNNLRANLLIAFQPIYDVIVPALTKLIQTLARATQYVAAFISGLFGRTYSESMKAAKGLQEARKAMDAYGKSAKRAAGLAGFDELNLIGGESAGEVDAGGGVDFGALADQQDISALDRVSAAMASVSEKAREMADRVRSAFGSMKDFILDNQEPIIAALGGITTAFTLMWLAANGGSLLTGARSALGSVATLLGRINPIVAIVAAVVAALTGAFIYFYRTNEKFKGVVDGILAKIGEVGMWLWENVMKPFGAWLADVMPKAWDKVVEGAMWLWQKVLVPFGNFLKWLWDNVLVPIGNVLKDLLGVAFKHVADIAKDFWQKVLVPLGKALKEMFEPAVEAVSAVLSFLWNKVLKPLGTYLGKILKPIILAIIDVFEFLWKHVLRPLVDFVGGTLRSVFSNVFDALGGIINGLKNVFIGLMNFITGVFTGDWKKAWEGVKQIFKGVFDSLWSIVKFPLNLIIDSINTMIDGLNKISFDIPDWVPGLGGKSFGISIPKIPKLAIGTDYVARDGLAYLHQGEAVVPANVAKGGFTGDNGETVRLLQRIAQALESNKGDLIFQVGTTEIGRVSANGINDITRRTGKSPLKILEV